MRGDVMNTWQHIETISISFALAVFVLGALFGGLYLGMVLGMQ